MENLHENFILLHRFEHPETPIKAWVEDDETYTGEYHKSWDCLMPVVEKIGKIKSDFEPLSGVSLYSNVGEIYKEVVEFVKRYNDKLAELTPEKKEAYLAFSFKCPYCDSDNIDAGRPYFEDVEIFVDVDCRDCEKEWVDVYSLTDIR